MIVFTSEERKQLRFRKLKTGGIQDHAFLLSVDEVLTKLRGLVRKSELTAYVKLQVPQGAPNANVWLSGTKGSRVLDTFDARTRSA